MICTFTDEDEQEKLCLCSLQSVEVQKWEVIPGMHWIGLTLAKQNQRTLKKKDLLVVQWHTIQHIHHLMSKSYINSWSLLYMSYTLTRDTMKAARRHVGMQEQKLRLSPVSKECECILPSCGTAQSSAPDPAMCTGDGV